LRTAAKSALPLRASALPLRASARESAAARAAGLYRAIVALQTPSRPMLDPPQPWLERAAPPAIAKRHNTKNRLVVVTGILLGEGCS
jgi:hypothetical protein